MPRVTKKSAHTLKRKRNQRYEKRKRQRLNSESESEDIDMDPYPHTLPEHVIESAKSFENACNNWTTECCTNCKRSFPNLEFSRGTCKQCKNHKFAFKFGLFMNDNVSISHIFCSISISNKTMIDSNSIYNNGGRLSKNFEQYFNGICNKQNYIN